MSLVRSIYVPISMDVVFVAVAVTCDVRREIARRSHKHRDSWTSLFYVLSVRLTLRRPLLPYGYSFKASCTRLVKPSFVIFGIRALRRSWLSVKSMDLIEQCFTSPPPPTQYRLYGRQFLQVKRPNQQYQITEGTNSTQTNETYNKQTWTQNTASPLGYNNMGWRLPQKAGLPGLNGGGATAAVPQLIVGGLGVKNYKWRLNPVWHRILYRCTHMATMGVKRLSHSYT